jgi:hypothetical protein
VFEAGQSPTPISAEKYSAKDSYRIEIGCVFFVTFFAQTKKVNECAHETKVSPVSATASKSTVVFLPAGRQVCYFLCTSKESKSHLLSFLLC